MRFEISEILIFCLKSHISILTSDLQEHPYGQVYQFNTNEWNYYTAQTVYQQVAAQNLGRQWIGSRRDGHHRSDNQQEEDAGEKNEEVPTANHVTIPRASPLHPDRARS